MKNPPNFEVVALSGQRDAVDFAAQYKGRPVILHFWTIIPRFKSSEILDLFRFAERHPNIAVVAVHLGAARDFDDLRRHIRTNYEPIAPGNVRILLDPATNPDELIPFRLYDGYRIPMTVFIRADGTIGIWCNHPLDWTAPAAERVLNWLVSGE